MLSITGGTGGANVGNVVLTARINTLPALKDLEKFKQAANGLGAGFDSILIPGTIKNFKGLEDTLDRIATRLGTTKAGAIGAADAFQSLQRRGYTMQAAIGTIVGTIGDLAGSALALVGVLGTAGSALVAVGGSFASLAAGMVVGKMAFGNVAKAVQQLSTGQNLYNRQIYESIQAFQQLKFQAEEAALSEEDASLKLEQARLALAKVQDLPPSNMVRREAELAYKRAELNLREAKNKTQDLQKQISFGIKKVPNSANPFYGLTKSQIAFAKYLVSIKGVFKGLNEAAASGFLPKLRTGIDGFIKDALPKLKDSFHEVGLALGDATLSFEKAFKNTDNISNLQSYFTSSAGVIRTFGDTANHAFGGVLAVLKAAEPLTKRFSDWVNKSAKGFETWAKKGLKNGTLTAFYNLAGDVAAKLGSVFHSVFQGINNIIHATFPSGVDSGAGGVMLKWLQGITDGFKRFTGNSKFSKWLENATKNGTYALSTVGKFLKIFLDMAGNKETKQFWEEIRKALPSVKKLLEDGQKAGPALARAVTQILRFFAAFSDSKALTSFLDTLGAIASALADFFSNPIIKGFLDTLGAFHGAVLAIALAIGLFKKAAMIMLGYGYKIGGVFKSVGRQVGYAGGMFKTFKSTAAAFKGNANLFSQMGFGGTKLSNAINGVSRFKAAMYAASKSIAATKLAAGESVYTRASDQFKRGLITRRDLRQARMAVNDLRVQFNKADAAQKQFFRTREAKAFGRNAFFQSLSNSIKTAFTNQTPAIKKEFANIGKVIASPFMTLKNSITNAMAKAVDGAKNFRNSWSNAIKSVNRGMTNLGKTMVKPFSALAGGARTFKYKLNNGSFGYNENAKGRLGAAGNAIRGFANTVGGRLGNIGQQTGFANKFNALMKSMALGAKNASIQYRLSWARANGIVGQTFNQLRTTMQNFERKGIRTNPMFNQKLGLIPANIASLTKTKWTNALKAVGASLKATGQAFQRTATYATTIGKAASTINATKAAFAGFGKIFSGRSQNLKQVFGGVLSGSSFTAKINSAKAGFKGLFQTFKQSASEAGRQYRMSVGKAIGLSDEQLKTLKSRLMNFSGKGLKNFNKELGMGFRSSMTSAWKAFSADIKGTSAYKFLSGKAQAMAGGVRGAAGIISGRAGQIGQAGSPLATFKTTANAFSLANRSMSENYRLAWARSIGYTEEQIKGLKAAMGNFTRKGIKNNPAFNQALGLNPGIFMRMNAGLKILKAAGVNAGNAIKNSFTNFGTRLSGIATQLKTSIPNALKSMRDATMRAAVSVRSSLVAAFNAAKTSITNAAKATGNGFKAIGTSTANIGRSMGNIFKSLGGSMKQAAIDSRLAWASSLGYTEEQLAALKAQMSSMSTMGIMTNRSLNSGLTGANGNIGYMGKMAGMMGTRTRFGAGALAAGIGASSVIGAMNNSEGKSGLGQASDVVKGIGMASMLAGPEIGIPVMLATSVVGGVMDMIDGNVKAEQAKKKAIQIAKAQIIVMKQEKYKDSISALIAQGGLGTAAAVTKNTELVGLANKAGASAAKATGASQAANADVTTAFESSLAGQYGFGKQFATGKAGDNKAIMEAALRYAGTTGALNLTQADLNAGRTKLTDKEIADAVAAAGPAIQAAFEGKGMAGITAMLSGKTALVNQIGGPNLNGKTQGTGNVVSAAQADVNAKVGLLQAEIDKDKKIAMPGTTATTLTQLETQIATGKAKASDINNMPFVKALATIKLDTANIGLLKAGQKPMTMSDFLTQNATKPLMTNDANSIAANNTLKIIAQNTDPKTKKPTSIIVNIVNGKNLSPEDLAAAVGKELDKALGKQN
jgi:hypothetical protein